MFLFEQKERASGQDAIMVGELRCLGPPSGNPRAILGIQILKKIAVAFTKDQKMAAGEGFILNSDVHGLVAADIERVCANFPPFADRAVFA